MFNLIRAIGYLLLIILAAPFVVVGLGILAIIAVAFVQLVMAVIVGALTSLI